MTDSARFVPMKSLGPQPKIELDWLGPKPWDVRFFPDYSADSPFWGPYGLCLMQALPLSEALSGEITVWLHYFETKFHHEHGWVNGGDSTWFAVRGRELFERSQIELGPNYVLTFEVLDARSPWG